MRCEGTRRSWTAWSLAAREKGRRALTGIRQCSTPPPLRWLLSLKVKSALSCQACRAGLAFVYLSTSGCPVLPADKLTVAATVKSFNDTNQLIHHRSQRGIRKLVFELPGCSPLLPDSHCHISVSLPQTTKFHATSPLLSTSCRQRLPLSPRPMTSWTL